MWITEFRFHHSVHSLHTVTRIFWYHKAIILRWPFETVDCDQYRFFNLHRNPLKKSHKIQPFQYFNEITGFPLNNFCINHEKMALTKFGNMSIKSLLAPIADSFLICFSILIYFYRLHRLVKQEDNALGSTRPWYFMPFPFSNLKKGLFHFTFYILPPLIMVRVWSISFWFFFFFQVTICSSDHTYSSLQKPEEKDSATKKRINLSPFVFSPTELKKSISRLSALEQVCGRVC